MMDDRLKKMKKTMDNTLFAQLDFTEQHRKKVHEKISKEYDSENDIFLAVLQLLVHEKSGYELAGLLRGRGIRKFEDNEGILYTYLHRLEQDGCLHSSWKASNIKHYCLSNKGRGLLRSSEKEDANKRFILNRLIEG